MSDLVASNTWFLGPTRVSPPNGMLIGSAVFAPCIRVTNTQTDTQTTIRASSVAIGRISCTAFRRCGPITSGWFIRVVFAVSDNLVCVYNFAMKRRWCMRAGKLTRLTCQRGKTLRVVGLTALGRKNRPLPPHAARRPHLSTLQQKIAATCNGRRRCYVSRRDLRVTRSKCPGVTAVFIDVSCTLRGGTTALETRTTWGDLVT